MNSKNSKKLLSKLSPQQLEVVIRVCKGYSYPAISKELYISLSSVKTHMTAVYKKLELSHLSRDDRKFQLRLIYCPLLQDIEETLPQEQSVLDSEPKIESAPITPDEEKILDGSQETELKSEAEDEITDGDEEEIIAYTPKSKNGGKEKMGTGNNRRGLKLVLVLIVAALLVFGGWQGLRWFSKNPIFSSGSAYEIGEWHKEDDLWIKMVDFEIDTYDRTEVYFFVEMWNKSDQDILFSWMPSQNLTLKDNTGRRYDLDDFSIRDKPENETLKAQSRMMLETFPMSYTAGYEAKEIFGQAVTELILTIEDLSRIDKVSFRLPINK